MANFLKAILFLVLAIVLGGSVSDAFTTEMVDKIVLTFCFDAGEDASLPDVEEGGAMAWSDIQRDCISAPQKPYFSDAEPVTASGHIQLLTFSHAQRLYTTEDTYSLKEMVEQLAFREGALSLHREKLFDTSAFYRYCPVCEYYVFALRRIII